MHSTQKAQRKRTKDTKGKIDYSLCLFFLNAIEAKLLCLLCLNFKKLCNFAHLNFRLGNKTDNYRYPHPFIQ
jgi:hypothetical protein